MTVREIEMGEAAHAEGWMLDDPVVEVRAELDRRMNLAR